MVTNTTRVTGNTAAAAASEVREAFMGIGAGDKVTLQLFNKSTLHVIQNPSALALRAFALCSAHMLWWGR